MDMSNCGICSHVYVHVLVQALCLWHMWRSKDGTATADPGLQSLWQDRCCYNACDLVDTMCFMCMPLSVHQKCFVLIWLPMTVFRLPEYNGRWNSSSASVCTQNRLRRFCMDDCMCFIAITLLACKANQTELWGHCALRRLCCLLSIWHIGLPVSTRQCDPDLHQKDIWIGLIVTQDRKILN